VSNASKLAVVALLAAIGPVLPNLAQAAQSYDDVQKSAADHLASGGATGYDGSWSVVIKTSRGDCPAAVRAGIHILGGKLLANDVVYQVNGRVAPDGAIWVIVSAGGQNASGSGRLSQQAGRGVWRTSLGDCSGQWTAERRG
jgi:hypothetical protein